MPCTHGSSSGHEPSRTCGPCCARRAWCGNEAHLHAKKSSRAAKTQGRPGDKRWRPCRQQAIPMQCRHCLQGAHKLPASRGHCSKVSMSRYPKQSRCSHEAATAACLPCKSGLTRCPAKVLDSLPCIFGASQQQRVAASGRQQGQLVESHDLAAGLHVGRQTALASLSITVTLHQIQGSTTWPDLQPTNRQLLQLGQAGAASLLNISVHLAVLPAAAAKLTAELLWPLPMRECTWQQTSSMGVGMQRPTFRILARAFSVKRRAHTFILGTSCTRTSSVTVPTSTATFSL